MIERLHHSFERAIVVVLMALLMVVVIYATLELGYRIFRYFIVYAPAQFGALERQGWLELLHSAYSAFLLILIGLELIQTVAMYLRQHVLHVEVVLMVAIIAVARHAIEVDYKTATPLSTLGLGVLTVALATAYWLVRRTVSRDHGADPPVNP